MNSDEEAATDHEVSNDAPSDGFEDCNELSNDASSNSFQDCTLKTELMDVDVTD